MLCMIEALGVPTLAITVQMSNTPVLTCTFLLFYYTLAGSCRLLA